jgi:Ni/Co efflux regulator RcnB
MKRVLSAVVAFAVALAVPASAQDDAKKKKKEAKKGPDTAAVFTKLDTSKDQKLSKNEFAAFMGLKEPKKEGKEPKGVAAKRDEWFKKLDANADGSLSAEEFAKLKDVVAANPAEKKKKVK